MTSRKDSLRKPSETWQRTNDQEATPDLPKMLLYDPITGDGDFQYLSLEERINRLIEEGRHDGFVEGRLAAFTQVREAMIAQDKADPHSLDWFEDQYHVVDELLDATIGDHDATK